VTPAFDEVRIIADTVRVLEAQLRQLGVSYELIVGDDGSSDGTAEAVRALALPHVSVVSRPHSGKGAILSACLTEAKGELAGFIDCDLEIDPAYLEALLDELERGCDAAIASKRADPWQEQERHWVRRLVTAGYNRVVHWLFASPILDHQAGLKIFRGDLIRAVAPRVRNRGWLWDTEVLLRLIDRGCTVREVPVRVTSRRATKLRPLATGLETVRELLRLRRLRKRGWA
jgi:dolichyl-phosphate beta-glucosyltransferase